MDILITTTIYPPDIGGPATYAKEIKEKLLKKGHKVIIFTTSQNAASEDHVYTLPLKFNKKFLGFIFHQIEIFIFLLRLSKRDEFDLIYTLNPGFLGLNSIMVSYFLSKPVLTRFGGDRVWEIAFSRGLTNNEPSVFYKNFNSGFYLKFLFYLQKIVLKLSKKVIVPSKSIKDLLVHNYKIKNPKIKIIYTSVEIKNESKPIKHKNFHILYVGRLIKLKRVDMIIKSIKDVSSIYPNLNLVIAGDGPEMNKLKRITSQMKLEKHVKFLGNVKRDQLSKVYLSSDLLILNSTYEVFPHVIIEAMKFRVPVITSSKGGAREIISNNKTGIIVSPVNISKINEKIIYLIENEKLRSELTENAYNEILTKFNWKNNLSLIENEFEELV